MTFEELKAARFVSHHRCGICDFLIGYEIHPEFAAACFQSGCDCGGTYPNWRVLTNQELADIPSLVVAPEPALTVIVPNEESALIASCESEGGPYCLPNNNHPIRIYSDGRVEDDLLYADDHIAGKRRDLTPSEIENVKQAVAELKESNND